MSRRSRRALLELLGTGAAALLAGCQAEPSADVPTERSTPTASSTSTHTPTATETATEPRRTSPTESSTLSACGTAPRPDVAWPVPRGSPARDGYVAGPAGFEEAPTVAWETEPTAPEDSYATPTYGRPVVAGDDVYLVNRLDRGPQRAVYGHVHALETSNSDRRWASARIRSPSDPVVWGELVVVVGENESQDAMVVAFDRAEGARRWTREFAARDRGVVAARDHLYLVSGAVRARGTVRALDQAGSTVWSREGALADHVNTGPAVGSDHLFAVTSEGRLYALDRDDGATDWTHRFEHPDERHPYVTDLVATGCAVITVVEGAVKAFDDEGTLVWEVAGDHGALATDGETVYTATGVGDERELRALRATTGEVRWTVSAPVRTPPVVADDAVYVRAEEHVVALDGADGTERWRTEVSLEDLALADGTLYGTRRGTLLALR